MLPSYFPYTLLVLPLYSPRTSLILPSYFHGTLHVHSCNSLILPLYFPHICLALLSYPHVLPLYFEILNSRFSPWSHHIWVLHGFSAVWSNGKCRVQHIYPYNLASFCSS